MVAMDHLTTIECPNCRVSLFWIPESPPDRTIVCTECGAAGSYEKVMKNIGGLIGGVLTHEELIDIRKRLGIIQK